MRYEKRSYKRYGGVGMGGMGNGGVSGKNGMVEGRGRMENRKGGSEDVGEGRE